MAILVIAIESLLMITTNLRTSKELQNEAIDDYLECVTYCSVENFAEGNDCQTICMERHLQRNYF